MKNKVTSSTQGKRWSWSRYLQEQNAEAAPLNLFTQYQAFLSTSNGFQVGMRLEGIDALHPAMFCVLSVAEVIGYCLRLHIDGYSECYDFWVNADSPDIRPAGWCKQHKHRLHPPKGHSETGFDWDKYLQSTNAQAAPDSLFSSQTPSTSATCQFEVGMRLEAVDRKNPFLVCVASISDVIAQRFLVHFDNWDDTYDYWCDSSSPYIHPVGWCEENKRPLTAPQGHPSPESFLWSEYLEENNWTAVPISAFTVKLEAVDRRNPMLIRVATVTETDEYRVKIHYDGWSDRFDLWCDSELSDLHPVGWCHQTGHPLEQPPGPSPIPSAQGACPTPGCRGVGHVRGAKYTGHHSAFGCPYSDMNMRKEVGLPDRLGVDKIITLVPLTPIPRDTHRSVTEKEEDIQETPSVRERLVLTLGKRPRHTDSSQPTKFCRVKEEEKELPVKASVPGDSSIHQSVFQSRELPLCWEQHSKLMPSLSHLEPSTVQHWSIEQVSEFVQSLPGCEDQASLFREEQIDGRAFLLLTQQDIVRILSIKLGPALKIYNSILMFRHAESKSVARGVDP